MDELRPVGGRRSGEGQAESVPARPDTLEGAPDIEEVERVVRQAIDRHQPDLLQLVGFGEFSLALRWTAAGVDYVVKRVPPFPDAASATAYRELTRDYINAIESSGVACVATRLLQLERTDGSAVVYHCQPLLDAGRLVSNLIRGTEPDDRHPVVDAVVGACGDIVGERMALDAQCSNWYWHDGQVWYLDLSTPLLLDDQKMVQFEIEGFAREYPRIFRPIVKHELLRLVPRYTDLSYVMHDLLANLHRDALAPWSEAFAAAIARQYGIEVSLDKAASMYRSDARLFPWLQRLRRAQRFWVQTTGRCYDSMLPALSSYGS